jgi:hypothetical protein
VKVFSAAGGPGGEPCPAHADFRIGKSALQKAPQRLKPADSISA